MTPQEMYDAAKFMKDRLEAITTEMGSLKTRVDDTASRWEGRAKDAFVPVFEDTHKQVLQALTDSINGLATGLDESAKALEQTDEGIANAFNSNG
jgi:WXG100 family type VII secretion target